MIGSKRVWLVFGTGLGLFAPALVMYRMSHDPESWYLAPACACRGAEGSSDFGESPEKTMEWRTSRLAEVLILASWAGGCIRLVCTSMHVTSLLGSQRRTSNPSRRVCIGDPVMNVIIKLAHMDMEVAESGDHAQLHMYILFLGYFFPTSLQPLALDDQVHIHSPFP